MFNISRKEQLKLNKWIKIKNNKDHSFTYCFTPTGIGMVIEVIDNTDNTKIDITDYKGW
jgi:hypothetical protein